MVRVCIRGMLHRAHCFENGFAHVSGTLYGLGYPATTLLEEYIDYSRPIGGVLRVLHGSAYRGLTGYASKAILQACQAVEVVEYPIRKVLQRSIAVNNAVKGRRSGVSRRRAS